MTFESLVRHLRVLWRAESIIANVHIRQFGKSSAFAALSVLLVVMALGMLSFAGYLALEPLWGPAWSAAAVGGIQIYIAAMAALLAHRGKPSRELLLANEVRQAALDAVQEDARALQAEMAALTHAIRHPFDAAWPSAIVPLATFILKALKKDTGQSA